MYTHTIYIYIYIYIYIERVEKVECCVRKQGWEYSLARVWQCNDLPDSNQTTGNKTINSTIYSIIWLINYLRFGRFGRIVFYHILKILQNLIFFKLDFRSFQISTLLEIVCFT